MASSTTASASHSVIPKALTVVIISACGSLGVYGTLVTGSQNGLFNAISHSLGPTAREPFSLGGPAPLRTAFTGIDAIDRQLSILVAFFTIAVDGPRSWDVTLSQWYLLGQFCAGFSLLVLEGLRQGNQGKLVSWTGTVGCALQRASYALCIPLYLLFHLFSSPVIYPSPSFENRLTVSTADLALLPFTSVFFFWVPALLMSLPSPSVLPPTAHYGWIAFWQVFPMWQSIWQWLLKQPLRSRGTAKPVRAHLEAAKHTYLYILGLAVLSQVTLLSVALIPKTVVPTAWAPVFAEVDVVSAFVPYLPWNSPTVESPVVPVSTGELAQLARLFLQWDIYPTIAAILVWALYLYGAGSGRSVLPILPKVFILGLAGGLAAPAAFLLWERDNTVMNQAFTKEKDI